MDPEMAEDFHGFKPGYLALWTHLIFLPKDDHGVTISPRLIWFLSLHRVIVVYPLTGKENMPAVYF